MLSAFLHGAILAIGLILPLGVQNFFVFSQGAIHKRFVQVLPIVITAAVCDTLLISLAVLGVSVVVMSFAWMKLLLVISGVAFLVYMGIISWKSKPKAGGESAASGLSFGKTVSFTLMLSLLNPHAILDTIGVIGTSSMSYEGEQKLAFTAACIIISWFWFFALAIAGKLLGSQDKSGAMLKYLGKVSAIVMWAAAGYLLYTL